jgi:hypothetical protein
MLVLGTAEVRDPRTLTAHAQETVVEDVTPEIGLELP